MCSCEFNFTCSKCLLELKNDLAVSFGDVDPPTPAEQAYDAVSEYNDRVVLRALAVRG